MLPQLTAANVPAVGPEEIPIDPPSWIVSTNGSSPDLPGKGLAQHPMLYIGEGCNKMFLINDGTVIGTYSTRKGWEYDDIWLMSNGNILFSVQLPEGNYAVTLTLGDEAGESSTTVKAEARRLMLPLFFKPGVAVANYAQSGESIKSSLAARRSLICTP